MEEVKKKYNSLIKALSTLEKAMEDFKKVEEWEEEKQEAFSRLTNIYYQDHTVSLRDSLIKRFEFTLELFWKYLKIYLEKISLLQLESTSPRNIIRSSCKIKLVTEDDAEKMFDMIKSRNLTSHIYQEEIAQQISCAIPKHYEILKKYVEKLDPETSSG